MAYKKMSDYRDKELVFSDHQGIPQAFAAGAGGAAPPVVGLQEEEQHIITRERTKTQVERSYQFMKRTNDLKMQMLKRIYRKKIIITCKRLQKQRLMSNLQSKSNLARIIQSPLSSSKGTDHEYTKRKASSK